MFFLVSEARQVGKVSRIGSLLGSLSPACQPIVDKGWALLLCRCYCDSMPGWLSYLSENLSCSFSTWGTQKYLKQTGRTALIMGSNWDVHKSRDVGRKSKLLREGLGRMFDFFSEMRGHGCFLPSASLVESIQDCRHTEGKELASDESGREGKMKVDG